MEGARRSNADDVLGIGGLNERYARAVDTKDWPSLAACFAEGGTFVGLTGTVEGGEQVVELVKPIAEPYPVLQHIFGLPDVTFDGDRASGSVYSIGVHALPGTPGGDACAVGVRYDDEYVRVGEEWRIASRRVTQLWQIGNAAVFDLVAAPGARGHLGARSDASS